jgi:hypothetical protein
MLIYRLPESLFSRFGDYDLTEAGHLVHDHLTPASLRSGVADLGPEWVAGITPEWVAAFPPD